MEVFEVYLALNVEGRTPSQIIADVNLWRSLLPDHVWINAWYIRQLETTITAFTEKPSASKVWTNCSLDVVTADALIVDLTCPSVMYVGALIEMGLAQGRNKPIYVLVDDLQGGYALRKMVTGYPRVTVDTSRGRLIAKMVEDLGGNK